MRGEISIAKVVFLFVWQISRLRCAPLEMTSFRNACYRRFSFALLISTASRPGNDGFQFDESFFQYPVLFLKLLDAGMCRA